MILYGGIFKGTATTEDMKALNEYISASPENKKYLFSIEELYHLGKWKYGEEEKINAAMQRLKSVVQPVEMSVVSEKKEKKQMKHLFCGLDMQRPCLCWCL